MVLYRDGLTPVDNDLLVDLRFNVAILQSFPRGYSSIVGVDLEYSHATMNPAIAGVSAKPGTTGIAHPQCGQRVLFLFVILG